MSSTTDCSSYSLLKLSSLSRLFSNAGQTGVHPLSPQPENPSPHISVNSEETHSRLHGVVRVRPSVGGSAMGKCSVAEKTCTKLNSPLGWVGVTRPVLPACSFIIPGVITDWAGCLVCLMLAQLLHGRNGLVSLCCNTLYYHLHFIYLAEISRQAACPPNPPKIHLEFSAAQPLASLRKLFKITCLKFSLKCHLGVTATVSPGNNIKVTLIADFCSAIWFFLCVEHFYQLEVHSCGKQRNWRYKASPGPRHKLRHARMLINSSAVS